MARQLRSHGHHFPNQQLHRDAQFRYINDQVTSKWNKIEHRLFWAGQPLTSHEVTVNCIYG